MTGQSERVKAIVLRRTNYAEADRVLQLLTPKGRRSVIAKGVATRALVNWRAESNYSRFATWLFVLVGAIWGY